VKPYDGVNYLPDPADTLVGNKPVEAGEESLVFGENWKLESGVLQTNARTRSFALWDTEVQTNLAVETEIVILEGVESNTYKVSGLTVYANERNFWHLALVESPDKTQRYIELAENWNGTWNAQYAEGSILGGTTVNGGFNWEYNHPYKLRLEITETSIVGSIYETDGTLKWKQEYRLYNQENSVKAGIPGFTSYGMNVEFRAYKTENIEVG
jgi:hypothetical protein